MKKTAALSVAEITLRDKMQLSFPYYSCFQEERGNKEVEENTTETWI